VFLNDNLELFGHGLPFNLLEILYRHLN